MSDESPSLLLLRELDEITDWEQSGDVLAVNDPEEGNAGVGVVPPTRPSSDDSGEGLDAGEDLKDILGCAGDMVDNGDVEDILIIVNLVDGDQVVFTTVERNDFIVGMLEVAKMNWFSTQLDLQSILEDEEYGEEV